MGIVPLGIGITVIAFLWGAPFGEFGSPPLFFRFFGSFIALAFVMVGAGILFGATTKARSRIFDRLGDAARRQQGRDHEEDDSPARPSGRYTCPHCGAPLADGADVSPHGDVKCTYCTSWFNIHGE
jgi:hypothetical protein